MELWADVAKLPGYGRCPWWK